MLAGYIKDSKYGKNSTLYHSTWIFLVLDTANTNTHQNAPGLHKDHNNLLLISHIKSKTDVYKFSLLDIYVKKGCLNITENMNLSVDKNDQSFNGIALVYPRVACSY